MPLNVLLLVLGVLAVLAALASVSPWLALGVGGCAAVYVGLTRDDGSDDEAR